ncbi:MAG: bifunctional tetrahydrofolate synthase/dihydrofolate synthase [Pseudomonadales bacterium]|nr:bifunctional tetrahydrofolate synthase/dihydrofolate synthase [Pseudomonadales bacterium]
MQLNDWLSRLERLHFKSIDMGLERIRAVAERLNLLSDTPFIFTVAGTNGKGSTVALLDAFLRNSGLKTAVYTSPHLVRFNERVCINGVECSDRELIQAFEAVEAGREETSLTYFEFTTLAAIWLFKQAKLDAWILEVGLGGRLDAVNLWNADVAVVTSIDLDHQAWLGNDRIAIGKEKIAVGRPGHPLVVGEPDFPEEVAQAALAGGMVMYRQGTEFSYHEQGETWQLSALAGGNKQQYSGLTPPQVYLQNAATAIQAVLLSSFDVSLPAIQSALSSVQPQGRRQILQRKPDLMVDVGHNPHAARALAIHIEQSDYRRVHCIVGMLADKDITDTLMALLPAVDHWYPVALDCDRAAEAGYLREQLLAMGALCSSTGASPATAARRLTKQADENDLILVFGSFYTVADVIQYVGSAHSEKG